MRTSFAIALMVFASSLAPSTPSLQSAFVLDGKRDLAYTLLAQDPSGDIAASLAGAAASNWADLANLHIATDSANLWVYVDLPNYVAATSIGEFGLAIDTDGLPGSGGPQDPWGNAITFAYTSTYNNVGTVPVLSLDTLRPDVVVRGRLYGNRNTVPSGLTELDKWNGVAWGGRLDNWGGVISSSVGSHVAFSDGNGLEFAIPYADLGVPPTTTLSLEFYATSQVVVGHRQGAWDTIPPDAQSQTGDNEATIERHLATFDPTAPARLPVVAFGSGVFSVAESAGTVPITITVAPTSTRSISIMVATVGGNAGPADYVPLSQTLSISPGQGFGMVPLHILTDTVAEPDKTVILSLSDPVNAQLGQPFTATLTIHDSPPDRRKLFLPVVRR